MTTYALIHPDDSVETDAKAIAEFQKTMLREGTVVTLTSPILATWRDPGDPWVGWVFDWGIPMGLPVNRKAWALYGRSPIYGPMLLATDLREPLPDGFLSVVASPIEEWVPADVLDAMNSWMEART